MFVTNGLLGQKQFVYIDDHPLMKYEHAVLARKVCFWVGLTLFSFNWLMYALGVLLFTVYQIDSETLIVISSIGMMLAIFFGIFGIMFMIATVILLKGKFVPKFWVTMLILLLNIVSIVAAFALAAEFDKMA